MNHNIYFLFSILSLVLIAPFGAINPLIALAAVGIAGVFFFIWYLKEMTKKEIVITLREQDRLLQEIFQTRKELAEMAKQEDIYDEVWDMLYSDKQSHYEF